MDSLKVLFQFGFKRRIKDSFLMSYGLFVPFVMILLLGYMSTQYYTGLTGVSSYYYYSLVSLPLYTLFSAITLVYLAREESEAHCGARFIMAPIRKEALILYKVLPSTVSVAFYNLLLMLICQFLFKVDFGTYFLAVYLLLIVLGFMSCTLGTLIGLCSSNFLAVKNLVSFPIMLIGLLGGSFFPVSGLGKVFNLLSHLSPLFYINRSLFLMLQDHSMSSYFLSLSIPLILGGIFMLIACIKLKKEAFV